MERRRIGTLHGAGTRLVGSSTVDIVLCLNRVTALAHHIEVIAGGIVLRRTVVAIAIATQLANGFHAGSTLVDDLHEVVITVGIDSDAHLHTGTDDRISQGLAISRQQFTGHSETAGIVLDVTGRLQELRIDSTPRGAF